MFEESSLKTLNFDILKKICVHISPPHSFIVHNEDDDDEDGL